jgi:hypothetical protein
MHRFRRSESLTWVSADRYEGTRRIDHECTGPGCTAAAEQAGGTFPCTIESRVIASRRVVDAVAPSSGQYRMTMSPTFTTCDAPPVPAEPRMIEVAVQSDQGRVELTFPGADDPVCQLDGSRAACSVDTEAEDLTSLLRLDWVWRGAERFEGAAVLGVECSVDTDCSSGPLGALPCVAHYHIAAELADPASGQ